MLTDNEIIKALECCSEGFGKTCEGMQCPMIAECQVDTNALEKAALDLNNRKDARIAELEAEIERLKEQIKKGDKIYEDKCLEFDGFIQNQRNNNEKLLKEIQEVKVLYVKDIARAKSEAYREFAERAKPILKEMFDLMLDDDEGKCIIENCKKHSSIPCMNEYCIKENWQAWETKIDTTLEELTRNLHGTCTKSNE